MTTQQQVWWVALATFERGSGAQDILSERHQGACGWIACLAGDETELRDNLSASLNAVGLRLVEMDRERRVGAPEDLTDIDEHLAANFVVRDANSESVWGAVHTYLAQGEC
jgi:hypothetical protein